MHLLLEFRTIINNGKSRLMNPEGLLVITNHYYVKLHSQ